MTDHAPGSAPRLTDATASSTREENPRTFPEGIPVRDAARTRVPDEPVPPVPWKTSTGTSSTTCPRRCFPRWSA